MLDVNTKSVIEGAYSQFGLQTPEPTREARKRAAESLSADLKPKAALALIRAALGVPIRDASPVDEAMAAADSEYSVGPGDQERRAVASAALVAALQERGQAAVDISLALIAAALGGVRISEFQQPIILLAQSRLFEAQRFEPMELDVITKKPPVMAEVIPHIEQAGAGNSFQAGAPWVVKALSSSVDFTQASAKGLAAQMQKLADGFQKQQEQLSVHWWVMGGMSTTEVRAFSVMPPLEAAARAASELADLTQASRWGLFPARQLLAEVLRTLKLESKHQLKDLPGLGSVESRLRVLSEAAQPLAATIAPLSYAAWVAADASDEGDWIRRFERASGLNADVSLATLDVAHQLYLERIALARALEW